jgi:hypothetical protein
MEILHLLARLLPCMLAQTQTYRGSTIAAPRNHCPQAASSLEKNDTFLDAALMFSYKRRPTRSSGKQAVHRGSNSTGPGRPGSPLFGASSSLPKIIFPLAVCKTLVTEISMALPMSLRA